MLGDAVVFEAEDGNVELISADVFVGTVKVHDAQSKLARNNPNRGFNMWEL